MPGLDGSKLTPIFWSEISSSYVLYEILKTHPDILSGFVKKYLDITGTFSISREKPYADGTVDIFIKNGTNHILLEIKVHDYRSSTPGQISTYFQSALNTDEDVVISFIYLTQFTQNAFDQILGKENIKKPPSITEHERAQDSLIKYRDRIRHISWPEIYGFLAPFHDAIRLKNRENYIMLKLQQLWMTTNIALDIAANTNATGARDITADYFKDVHVDWRTLGFGKSESVGTRRIHRINLAQCTPEQITQLKKIIKDFIQSAYVDTGRSFDINPNTAAEIHGFFKELSVNESDWALLSFYSDIFSYVQNKKYVLINGEGDFSLKVVIRGRGEISLCTIYRNKTMEFSIKR